MNTAHLERKISLYKNLFSVEESITDISILELYGIIKSDTLATATNKLRTLSNSDYKEFEGDRTLEGFQDFISNMMKNN